MLKIHFGKKTFPKEILQVDQVFDLNVNNDWLNTDFAKRVIKGIDNSEHIVDSYIKSPFWGTIPPQKLSTGCKNVLLMKFYPLSAIFYGTKCGDNCLPYVLEIAQEKDLEVHFQHMMCFPDAPLEAYIVELDRVVYSSTEVMEAYVDYWYGVNHGEIVC